jgi:hypothetical protein
LINSWPFKKKPKYQVYFTCEDWAIRKYAPIQPAKNFLPSSFKSMPTFLRQCPHAIDSIKTVKACPGIVDYSNAGFVIPAWCDIELHPTPDGNQVMARYSHPKFNHAIHVAEQLQDLMCNKFDVRVAVKLDNPWFTWTEEGYSLLYLPMYYDDTKNWEAVPGIIDHDVGAPQSPINIMLKERKPTFIKMGEPLVQIIPIKREEITAYTGELTEVGRKRQFSISYLHNMMFSGWIKHMRKKKHYIVDAHDIELSGDTNE